MVRYRLLWLVLLGSVLVAGGGVLSDVWSPGPGAAKAEGTRMYDLDRDGIMEQYKINNGQLTVSAAGQETWRSPAEWRVTGYVLADATNDGQDDLLLVVWKQGSYGRDKPFWYSGNDDEYTNHLFVYNRLQGKMHQSWGSSALEQPILELSVTDVDSDGKNELVVRENGGDVTTWRWQNWGFYQVDCSNQD